MGMNTAEMLNDLGRELGHARRNMKLSDNLYQMVHAVVEQERYGGWTLSGDDEDFDSDYSSYDSADVLAFVRGWLEGSHNTAEEDEQCTLGMCGCSIALPDRPAVSLRSPAAAGAGDSLADAGGLSYGYIHKLAARCNRCGTPLMTYLVEGDPNRVGGWCENPFCKGTTV